MRDLIKKYFYKRKTLLDPTKNFSKFPQNLIKKYSGKNILNIGAGDEDLGKDVLTLDLFSPADISADAIFLPIKTNSIDLALSIAVLEHLKEPQQAIQEIFRILKPGGEVYIEIPFLQPFHASPNDYFRTTLPGLKHWCRELTEIESGVCVGSGSALAWLKIEYIKLLFEKCPVFGLLTELFCRICLLPLKYLDKYLVNKNNSHISASAIYFYGKKT